MNITEFLQGLHGTLWFLSASAAGIVSAGCLELGVPFPDWFPFAFWSAVLLTVLAVVWIPPREDAGTRRERRRNARCLGTVRIQPDGTYILVKGGNGDAERKH